MWANRPQASSIRDQAELMQFCNGTIAKVLVWLAAILVPAEALPSMACDCGSRSSQLAEAKSGQANTSHAAKCPHCTSRLSRQRSCCREGGFATHGSCCGAKSACSCCKGGQGSHAGMCQCAASKSTPVSVPVPGNSRTDENAKSSAAATCLGGLTTFAALAPPAASAGAEHQPAQHCLRVCERLSILCRLVI